MKAAEITQSRGIFSMTCGVALTIRASAGTIWGLLTDAKGFPRVVPSERMTWTGGFFPVFKGVRTFELKPCGDGSTEFVMRERFSGLMLPFVKGSMPDLAPVFERYAGDLKREAELAQPLRRDV